MAPEICVSLKLRATPKDVSLMEIFVSMNKTRFEILNNMLPTHLELLILTALFPDGFSNKLILLNV